VGRPITGDLISAMKRGPVLSTLLDIIKGHDDLSIEWSKFIQKMDYNVQLVEDPGLDRLTRREMAILDAVIEEYRAYDEWEMVELTHTLPEWLKNDPGESSKEIPLGDILEATGRQEDLEDIEEDARLDVALSRLANL
jgi:uncharacterized phage-associated protein